MQKQLCKYCNKPITNNKTFCSLSCAGFYNGHKIERIDIYNRNPLLCKNCNDPIPYIKKILGNIFCNNSCATSYNNNLRAKNNKLIGIRNKTYKPRKCHICGKDTPSTENKFCEPYGECFKIYKYQNLKQKILSKNASREAIKKYLIITKGHKCELCELTKWCNIKIPLEVHHTDGNYKNNNIDNLQLICPNCHSLTPNYRKPKVVNY